jgi:hypothetical protein
MQVPPVSYTPLTVEEYQAMQDADQLRILSTLKLVYGILILVGSFFVLLYFGFFGFMMSSMETTSRASNRGVAPPPDLAFHAFGSIFLMFALFAMVIMWVLGWLAIYSGKCIRERRNWTLVMVSACLNCIHMPLGTALGVYTIIVINKPSVKATFDVPQYRAMDAKSGR